MQTHTSPARLTPPRARTRLTRHARRMLTVAALSLGLSSAALPHDYEVGQIHINAPWARATLAGQRTAAGYLSLENRGETQDKLLAVDSDIAERVELHTMAVENDIMRMREVDDIALPAGETVELKPGGLHLMFINLRRPLKEGDTVTATLRFERAGTVTVAMQVEAASKGRGGHDGHGAHGAHGAHGGGAHPARVHARP